MKLNKKSNSLQKISLNKTRKNNKNKKIEDTTLKIKEKNDSLGKTRTKKEKINNINSIFKAIKSSDDKKFEEILKENKSLINKLNNNGLSLLHYSVIKNNKKILELLLNNGADVNIKSSKMKRTPLHLAYIYQNNSSDDIINLLIKYGAKDDILDSNNKKPSQYKKNNNEKENKNGGENKLKKIKIKKIKEKGGKEGYKGNIYNLKDSKDNSFVVITMDNISYLTSDENTINQVSELTITKNNSISNSINNNNILLEDSLEEKDIKIKNNSLNDSLEMTNENDKIPVEYVDNIFKNKYKYNSGLMNNIKDKDLINSSENMDSFFTALITNKRNSFVNSGKIRASIKTEDKNTILSHYDYTENSTFRIIKNENDNEKKMSKKISQHNSAISTLSQTNKKNNKNEIENIDYNEINNNCSYLLKWLIDIGLSDYYENFLNNKIFDINRLIEQMKSPNDKFGLEDIENILGIHKPGHIYRLLVKLEIDGDIIDKSISNFMISDQKINKKLIFSSDEKYECGNWCSVNRVNANLCGIKNININLKNGIKNDLESFLSRYNLMHLYQNFFHNGFEEINYVILQMYSSYPINNDILENCFHIYNEEQRILTMDALQKEVFKVNIFINSEKYLKNENKDIIKYENIDFKEEENQDKNDKECLIF